MIIMTIITKNEIPTSGLYTMSPVKVREVIGAGAERRRTEGGQLQIHIQIQIQIQIQRPNAF